MEIVSFEIAKKLKEKGFKEECLSYYTTEYTLYNNVIILTDDKYLCVLDIDYEEFLVSHNSIKYTNGNYVDAPTISQVLKWLREEKRIDAGAVWNNMDGKWVGYVIEMDMPDLVGEYISSDTYESYELAAIAGIECVIDNLI